MTNLILNYMSAKLMSYVLNQAERLFANILDLKNQSVEAPTSETLYNFQVFFMPNDNETLEREIELLPSIQKVCEESWEFIN